MINDQWISMDHISQRHIPNFSSGSYDNGTNMNQPPSAMSSARLYPTAIPKRPMAVTLQRSITTLRSLARAWRATFMHACREPRLSWVTTHHWGPQIMLQEHVEPWMEGEAREVTWNRTWGNKCWVTITIEKMDGGCTSCYIVTWAVLLDDGLHVEMVGWLQLNSPSAREWTRQNVQGLLLL
jgi:hypothetical protein